MKRGLSEAASLKHRHMKRLFLVVVSVLLIVTACFEFPIGDRGATPVDAKYSGLWLRKTGGENSYDVWIVAPFDATTYCVYQYQCDADGEPHGASAVYQGWLTRVEQTVFMSVEHIVRLVPETNPKQKHSYSVAQLTLGGDGTLIVRQIDSSFAAFKGTTSSKDLAARVMTNIGDPRVFKDTMTLHRVNPNDPIDSSIRDNLILLGAALNR